MLPITPQPQKQKVGNAGVEPDPKDPKSFVQPLTPHSRDTIYFYFVSAGHVSPWRVPHDILDTYIFYSGSWS